MDTGYSERIGRTRNQRDMGQEECCYMSITVSMQWRDGICVVRLSRRASDGVKFSLKSLRCLWEFATGCQMPPKSPIMECAKYWKGRIRKPLRLWGTSTTILIGKVQKGRKNMIEYSWILLRPALCDSMLWSQPEGRTFWT